MNCKIAIFVIATMFSLFPMVASAAAKSKEELADSFRKYNDPKNCDGLVGLFYLDGVEKDRIKVLREQVCSYFDRNIESFTFEKSDPIFIKPIEHQGKTYIATLPPSGTVNFKFADAKKNGVISNVSQQYGTKSGKYYFITSKIQKDK